MSCIRVVVLSALIGGCWSVGEVTFPSWFMFGASTSSYQVEGAWNVSDKGEGGWDRLLHTHPEIIADGSNGDVACDSYHLWRRDIEMAVELGLDMYRFSISWPRLLPNGFSNYISEDGKKYYNNLIDGLLERGIQPVVTIYHFDLPQILQDLGGWANPLISDWFADYARVVFSLYADRVKIWLTLNEPFATCDGGFNRGAMPYLDDAKIGMYLCNKNSVVAHAKAWRIYDDEFKPKYHGKVSISALFFWFEPAAPEEEELTQLTFEYWEGRYAYPIFSKEGGWPKAVEKLLNDNARREGYPYPRLPPFTAEETAFVRGTYDFYGLNHYTTRLVRQAKPGEYIGVWPLHGTTELNMVMVSDPSWPSPGLDWFSIYPEGLRKQLHWINSTYGVKEILITENGVPTMDPGLDDSLRLEYTKNHLEQIQLAIADGLNVTGYTAWALMDNFEWLGGYSTKFGLYAVDFTDPNRKRTPRESAKYYAGVTRSRSIHPAHDGMYYE